MSLNNLSPVNQKYIQNTAQNTEKNIEDKAVSTVKKINKKKLALSVAAGTAVTALVVGGILYKKRIDSKTVKQLAEHIEFQEAQTLEEAIKFGIDNLGIKKYKCFKETDLEVVNWINEGLVNINNRFKGKAKMPNVIKYSSSIEIQIGEGAACMDLSGTLQVSKKNIEKTKALIKDFINALNGTDEQKQKIIGNLTYAKAKNIMKKIIAKNPEAFAQTMKKYGYEGNFYCLGTFDEIYHEMGHFQHLENLGADLFRQVSSYDLSKTKLTDKGKKLWDLFNKSKDTVLNVSDYAKTTPAEFVAETFSQLCHGRKFDDSVLNLYQKLGGVIV